MDRIDLKLVDFHDSFLNRLSGIIHLPSDDIKSFGIILINSGLKDRSGPHRLYFDMAQGIAKKGFPVLRYDAPGLGESEGRLGNSLTIENFAWIQKGLFVDSVFAAIQYFMNEIGIKKIVLGGLCGGAVTAVLASKLNIERLAGLFLIAPDIFFYSQSFEKNVLKFPFHALLASGHFIRYLSQLLKHRISALRFRNMDVPISCRADFNFYFSKNFMYCIKNQLPMLIFLSKNDPTSLEFSDFLLQKFNQIDSSSLEVVNFVGVDHEFGSKEVVGKMEKRIGRWLLRLSHKHV